MCVARIPLSAADAPAAVAVAAAAAAAPAAAPIDVVQTVANVHNTVFGEEAVRILTLFLMAPVLGGAVGPVSTKVGDWMNRSTDSWSDCCLVWGLKVLCLWFIGTNFPARLFVSSAASATSFTSILLFRRSLCRLRFFLVEFLQGRRFP